MKNTYAKLQEKRSATMKLEAIEKVIYDVEANVFKLEELMKKEQKDVERLEKGGLTSMFFTILGDKEVRLDKERREAHEAKVKYDSALYQLNVMEADKEHYENVIASLQGIEEVYAKMLNEKLSVLKNNAEVVRAEEALISSNMLIKEIREAISAGQDAFKIADEAMAKLEEAESWSTVDLISDSFIFDMIKYGSMNDAEKLIQQLQAKLNRFKVELTDVKVEMNIVIALDGFMKVADILFDNIFTDFMVRDHIEQALTSLDKTMLSIHEVLQKLDALLVKEQEEKARREDILANLVMNSEIQ